MHAHIPCDSAVPLVSITMTPEEAKDLQDLAGRVWNDEVQMYVSANKADFERLYAIAEKVARALQDFAERFRSNRSQRDRG